MFKKRVYWIVALVALLALSGAAVSLTSRITSADSPTPTPAVGNSDQQGEVEDTAEAPGGSDTDAIEEQTGNQDEVQDANGQDSTDSSLSGAAVSLTSRMTSADSSTLTPAVANSDQQAEVDDASEEVNAGPDADNVEEESGDQNATENGAEAADASADTVVPCSDPTGADDAAEEANAGPDTDNIEEQCGDQNAAEDGDVTAPSGTLDDGKDLLPQAGITIDQAIAAAQTAASGSVGEIDLEQYQGKLVFNVDVGDKDVKVDATDGSVVAVDSDD